MAGKFDAAVRTFTEATIRHRILTSVLALAVVGATGYGTSKLAFDTRYRIWFSEGSEALVAYDTLLERFGSDDQAVISFRDPDGALLDNDSLLSIRRLTDALWSVAGVKRVDSLANFSITRASRVELESPAFVSTDRFIAAAGDKHDIVVWRTDDWSERRLRGHSGLVEHLVVNAAGDTLYSGGVDRTVRVWDLETGALRHTYRGFIESISTLTLAADGKRLYAGSYKSVYVAELESQRSLTKWRGPDDYVTGIVESPDGQKIFAASRDISTYDRSGTVLTTWKTGARFVNDIVSTVDGAGLVAALSDGRIIHWPLATGAPVELAGPNTVEALCLATLPDGRQIAAGMTDGSVRAFDLKGEPPILTRIHGDWVVDVAADADGVVYSASRDRNIARHSPGEGPQIVVLTAHRAAARRVSVLDDGRLFSLGDDGDVYAWAGNPLTMQARLRRSASAEPDAAVVMSGAPVGRLRAINGFRFPVELRVGGQSRIVHGAKAAELSGLSVPESSPCEDDDGCGPGQYCDYEQDPPSCAGQTVVEAFYPNSDVRVWAGEAFLSADQKVTIRIPSDEPFSVGSATESPLDERTRLGVLTKTYPQPALQNAIAAVLGDNLSDETFISPDDASAIDTALGANESVPRECREFLTTLAQSELSPLRLPMHPFRLRELEYHMMRPPQPPALGAVLNASGDATMMIVSLHEPPPEEALTRPFAVRAAIENLVAQEQRVTGHAYHVIGGTIMDTWLEEYARRDLEQLGPLFLAVVALLLGVVYRRFSGIIVPLGLVGLAVVIATGTAGWLGASLNNMTVAVPHVILASCIGDAVHIFNAYVDRVRSGLSPREATVEAVATNFQPCLWTTVSTAVGFFSLSTSPITPVKTFGWMAGIGVVMAFVLSMTVLPAITASLPAPKKKADSNTDAGGIDTWIDRRLAGLAEGVNRSTGAVIFLCVFFIGLAAFGLTKVEVDTNDLKFFAESAPFRQGAEFVEDNISGSYALQLMVELGGQGRIRKVDYLQEIDELRAHIEKTPEVKSITSITETLKTMNRVMSHDLVEDFRLPQNDKRASSYYDAYTFSLPAGLDLTNRVSATEGATVLDVRFAQGPSSWFINWGDELTAWANERLEKVEVNITGKSWLYTNMAKDVAEGFLQNVGSAILLISLMILVLARGFRVGIPAMLANIIPILTTVGVLGLLDIALDISILVSCCVALGVVVDDTTHFITKYRKQLIAGATHDEAVVATVREAGKAMVFTTVILVCGFSMLAFTDFAVNRNFGLVVAVMLLFGAMFDLTALPALLKLTHRP